MEKKWNMIESQKKELAGLTEPSHLRLNCIVYSLKKKKKKKKQGMVILTGQY